MHMPTGSVANSQSDAFTQGSHHLWVAFELQRVLCPVSESGSLNSPGEHFLCFINGLVPHRELNILFITQI